MNDTDFERTFKFTKWCGWFKIVLQINVCNSSNPQSSALDPLGILSGSQTPHEPALTTNPGSAPAYKGWSCKERVGATVLHYYNKQPYSRTIQEYCYQNHDGSTYNNRNNSFHLVWPF